MIANMKKDVSIWNINSFGEFYLQIAEKYKKNYAAALVQIRNERKRFFEALSKIDWMRVIPSQANYIMVELKKGINAKELTKTLLIEHNLIVKDLTNKLNGKNYLRIAIRDSSDNNKLISVLNCLNMH